MSELLGWAFTVVMLTFAASIFRLSWAVVEASRNLAEVEDDGGDWWKNGGDQD